MGVSMSDPQWILLWAVIAAGGVIKGAIGFALPIFTVPFLSLFMGPREAVVLMSVPVLLANLADVRWGLGEWRNLRRVAPYFAAGVLAVPFGVKFLHWGDPETIRFLIGLAVFAFLAVRRFIAPMEHLSPGMRLGAGVSMGAAAGFLMGMASLPGPVSIVYFSMFAWPKEVFIFVLSAFNSLASASQISSLALGGNYAAAPLAQTILATLPVFLGYWAGLRIRGRLEQKLFNRLVSFVMFFIASSLVGRFLLRATL